MPANPLNTDDFGGELYNLGMSEGARPLLDHVKSFIAEEVEDIRGSVAPDLFTGFDPARFPTTTLSALALTSRAYAQSPATGEAVRQFRAEGRRHIAVASLFLAPGFLPDRAAELAVEAGAIAVSEPLGAHPELARTILARYAVGAVELVPV